MANQRDKRKKEGGGLLGRLPTPKLPGQKDAGGGQRPSGQQPGGSRFGGGTQQGQGQQGAGGRLSGIASRFGGGGQQQQQGGRPGGQQQSGGSRFGGGARPGGQQQQSGSRFGGGTQPGGRPGGQQQQGSRPGGPQQQSTSRFGGGTQPGGRPGGQQQQGSRPGGPQQQSTSRFGGGTQPGGRPGGQQQQGGRPGGPQQQSTSRFGGGTQPGGQQQQGSRPGGPQQQSTSRFGGGTRPGGQQQQGSRPGGPQQQSTSRFGGGTRPSGQQQQGSRPGGPQQQSTSRFGGGTRPGGQQQQGSRPGGPQQGTRPGGQPQQQPGGSKLPPPRGGGQQRTAAQTTQAAAGKPRTRAATPARAKPRTTTKKKKKQDQLLTLDTKLDIIGVASVGFALITILSFLSRDPGKFTGAWLRFIRQLFGWGAFLVPFALGALGVWLILRRFEDKLPDIEPLRVIGGTLAFAAFLTGLHFFLLIFNPSCPAPDTVVLPSFRMAVCGHGGGYVGALLYQSLLDLIGGGGVFVTFVGVGAVGALLAADMTAKQAVELGVRTYHNVRKGGPATAFKRTKGGTMVPVQAEGEADKAKAKGKTAKPGDGKAPAKAEPAKAAAQKATAKTDAEKKPDDKAKRPQPKLPGIGEKAAATGATAAATAASVATAAGATAAQAAPAAAAAAGAAAATPAPRPAPARPAPSRPGTSAPTPRPGAGPTPGAPPARPAPSRPADTPPGPAGRDFARTVRPAPKPGAAAPEEAASEADAVAEVRSAPPVPPPPRPVTPPPRPGLPPVPSAAPPASKPTAPDDDGAEAKASDEPEPEEKAPARPPVVERVAKPAETEEPAVPKPVAEAAVAAPPAPSTPAPIPGAPEQPSAEAAEGAEAASEDVPDEFSAPPVIKRTGAYKLPDFRDMLKPGVEKTLTDDELRRRAEIIENTLASFGAPGRVVEVNQGPVITQFGVEPDYIESRAGKRTKVKVGKISALADDIALALAAPTIRIEAPVPGKGYVGVEVPNPEPSLVSLREIMDSDRWAKVKSALRIGLGQDVSGQAVAADLTSMPHLLVAGTTGSGKSVCINGIISALLLTNTPDDLQMIMVDPKRVELTNYNGIPHLMAPVVTELERIVGVLKWVQREMDERYRKFAMAGARNITDFNRRADQNGENRLYYIVVIVDELADLMMLAPDETERVVTRLAQMARATGIHIIISTQRPSVDVVTGLIKANFPARIAFAVPTGIDSRVILDMPGAEKLLGRGDMLFQAPDAAMPLRLQGTFVSDEEIQQIVDFWRGQAAAAPAPKPIPVDAGDGAPKAKAAASPGEKAPPAPVTAVQRPLFTADDEESDGSNEDALFDEAVALAREMKKISISLLQRRLRIGYTRAARLIDLMEEKGIIGPHEGGSKPRKVLPPKSGDKTEDDE